MNFDKKTATEIGSTDDHDLTPEREAATFEYYLSIECEIQTESIDAAECRFLSDDFDD